MPLGEKDKVGTYKRSVSRLQRFARVFHLKIDSAQTIKLFIENLMNSDEQFNNNVSATRSKFGDFEQADLEWFRQLRNDLKKWGAIFLRPKIFKRKSVVGWRKPLYESRIHV